MTPSKDDVRASILSLISRGHTDDTNTPHRLSGVLEVLKSSRSMAGPEEDPGPAMDLGNLPELMRIVLVNLLGQCCVSSSIVQWFTIEHF